MSSRKKRILIVAAVIVLTIALVVALFPIWFPWLLRPMASRYGARFAAYERVGWTRFALHDAAFTNWGVEFTAARVEFPLPTALLWRRASGAGGDLTAVGWSLRFPKNEGQAGPAPTSVDTARDIEDTLAKLKDWIARAALTNGVVTFQQQTAAVPWLVFTGKRLDGFVVANVPRVGKVEAGLAADLPEREPMTAWVTVPKLGLASRLVLERSGTNLLLSATNFWGTNQLVARARFDDAARPEWASIAAPAFHLADPNLARSGYAGLSGSLEGTWTNDTFELSLSFRGASAAANRPPFSGELAVRGDTNSVTLRSLDVLSPALRLDLSNPVRFSYAGELLSGPARLSVTGDLARLPVADGRGVVRGFVEVERAADDFPRVELQLTATNASVDEFQLQAAELAAELHWPVLQVQSLRGQTSSGAEFQATAIANLPRRFITNGWARVSGPLPTHLVPAALRYSNLTAVVEFSGPTTNLLHHATARIAGFHTAGLAPLAVTLEEQGRQLSIDRLHLIAAGAGAELELAGAAELKPSRGVATLDVLNYSRAGERLYALAQPVGIQVQRAAARTWRVQMTPLAWRGDQRLLELSGDLSWPQAGDARLAIAGLDSSTFTNFLATPPPVAAFVSNFTASALWSNGPVSLAAQGHVIVRATNAPPVAIQLAVTNDATMLHVPTLNVAVAPDDATVISGQAALPLSLVGTTNGFSARFRPDQRWRAELHTWTNAAVSTLLARFTQLNVAQPSLHLSLEGTLLEPAGELRWRAASVASTLLTNQLLPAITDLKGVVTFERAVVRLREFEASIAGQAMMATGALPLARSAKDLSSLFEFERLSGSLRLPSAEIAAFAPFATNVLAARGTLEMNVIVQPGLHLSGYLAVTNAATVPLPKLGAIGDIDGRVELRDESIHLEAIRGHAGGGPFLLTGRVDIASWKPKAGTWPRLALHLTATNIALVREAQKIIRTDADLWITNAPQGTPVVSGALNLRDSLFLAGLRDLVPGGVTKPSQRPPYFSVEAGLLQDWRLQVRVHGARFLTVRTPVFRGVVSADLTVQGTLRDAIAVGSVSIDRGRIEFPFAGLEVKQGFVTLSSANPYAPSLFVTAAGRAFDYDIRLEITGTANQPVLEFSAVPPLTSEQVLLMVAAGELPRSDYTLSTGQRAQRLGMFLGKRLFTKLGVGGKEKLSIRSGERISEGGHETYLVEYKLTDDVSLIGEYDRFDQYNAGVKWTVFSK